MALSASSAAGLWEDGLYDSETGRRRPLMDINRTIELSFYSYFSSHTDNFTYTSYNQLSFT